ncbi:HEPN domain-containing protein [Methanobacterium sp.]|uniref:HEPN domain-containing protein n=1 Tax=Methanobacterium sp. TaxID=2164 RepID=UPI0025F6C079|nr:HEPN domain-containing protein [Methanobacterium sp.]MBI5458108.1 HEPN domain-containing protein [Methanobacterium sp.]
MNALENCFRRRQLLKVEPSLIKSERSIQESYKWLKESHKNIEGSAYSSAQLSTYLVFFHAARAVLYRDGVREKSHYCIGVYLEAYQNEGLLEENWIILFDRMRNNRHAGQYSFQVEPTKEEVESGIKSAVNFLKRIIELLRTTEPLAIDLY